MNLIELKTAIEAANRVFGARKSSLPVEPAPAEPAAKLPIPVGAVLLAPRYDGGSEPLPVVPRCWCCATPWRLEQLQEHQGKMVAWLAPGCACLNALACYRCFACRQHCRCKDRSCQENRKGDRRGNMP